MVRPFRFSARLRCALRAERFRRVLRAERFRRALRAERFRPALRAATVAAAALAAAGAAVFGVSWACIDAPLAEAESYPEGIVLRDREGTELRATLGPGDVDCRPRRKAVRDEWISKAVVASEDQRFWEHGGADFLERVAESFRILARVHDRNPIDRESGEQEFRTFDKPLYFRHRRNEFLLQIDGKRERIVPI